MEQPPRKLYPITRRSTITGKLHTFQMPFSEQEFLAIQPYLADQRHRSGGLIQNILPEHSPDQREYILSGITPQEWKEMFGDEDDAA